MTSQIVTKHAQIWPRSVFDMKEGNKLVANIKQLLSEPGVYVLYREDHPYYIGKTDGELFRRIWQHANRPHDRYYNFWTHFSTFVVLKKENRREIEGILIAAMPLAVNSANPRIKKITLPASVRKTLRKERRIEHA